MSDSKSKHVAKQESASSTKETELTIDERAVILAQLEDPPEGLAQLRGVLMNEHEWLKRTGLDP